MSALPADETPRVPGFAVALLRALHAERLKLQGTLALWMCLVAPALVMAVVVLQLLISEQRDTLSADQAWMRLSMGVTALWSFLMLPLFVTLEAALLAQLEHGGNQWRRLLALPLPREVHYLAKLIALAAMLLAAQVAILLLVALGGGVLMVFKPEFGLAGPPPFDFLATAAARAFVASA